MITDECMRLWVGLFPSAAPNRFAKERLLDMANLASLLNKFNSAGLMGRMYCLILPSLSFCVAYEKSVVEACWVLSPTLTAAPRAHSSTLKLLSAWVWKRVWEGGAWSVCVGGCA